MSWSRVLGRTRSHRNHCMKTGPGCTTQLHSLRRNYWTTCSSLVQVQVWEVGLSGSAAVLDSAEVLESVQPSSAPELVRRARP